MVRINPTCYRAAGIAVGDCAVTASAQAAEIINAGYRAGGIAIGDCARIIASAKAAEPV
ncbi:MAG: hypothetical protein KAJ46_02865 [Sedimentisphaerales bacterium]|nr:hypothetical protein [Sedimentisphaerales bacterium]